MLQVWYRESTRINLWGTFAKQRTDVTGCR